jgi:monoamine oxidase
MIVSTRWPSQYRSKEYIPTNTGAMGSVQTESYDVLIIGAGLSGVCSLYHLRKRFPSWNIKVLEAAGSVGGTWYWNR